MHQPSDSNIIFKLHIPFQRCNCIKKTQKHKCIFLTAWDFTCEVLQYFKANKMHLPEQNCLFFVHARTGRHIRLCAIHRLFLCNLINPQLQHPRLARSCYCNHVFFLFYAQQCKHLYVLHFIYNARRSMNDLGACRCKIIVSWVNSEIFAFEHIL